MRIGKGDTASLILYIAMVFYIGRWGDPVAADEWGPSTPEHWSENGIYVLRVDDDRRTLTLKAKRQNGFALRWSIPFPQEHAPYEAHITDDGRFVVLQDEHGEVGYGKVLVFLGATGNVLASYTLEDIITDAEILDAPSTISSVWWSSGGLFFFPAQQTQFAFVTAQGTIRCFDLASGRMLALGPQLKAQVRGEAIQKSRDLLCSDDAGERIHGAAVAAALGDKESIPALKRLLDDPTAESVHWVYEDMTGDHQAYRVRLAAGRALVKLLGANAAPLIDARLRGANDYMAYHWIPMLADTGAAGSSEELRKLTRSRNRDIRSSAIRALLKSDGGTALRQSMQWLRDKNQDVRYRAIRVLAENAQENDAALLRAALKDADPVIGMWALHGLVQLDVPDLDEVLRRQAQRDDHVGDDAILELARRGDVASLQQLVGWLDDRYTDADKRERRGRQRWNVSELCKVLAAKQPPGAEAVLRPMSETPYPRVQRPALGALAALGHEDALERVRGFAGKGDALDRADAIEWLGICKDARSLDSLHAALKDEEPWVRDAAREALKAMPAEVLQAWRKTRAQKMRPKPAERTHDQSMIPLALLVTLAVGIAAVGLLRRFRGRSS